MAIEIPYLETPVQGVHKGYTMLISDKADSTEYKYMIRGVWWFTTEEIKVHVHGLLVTSSNPNHVQIIFSVDGGDGVLEYTYANDVVPYTPKLAAKAEDEEPHVTFEALHHGYCMYLRVKGKKTYTYMITGLNRGIRGNATYEVSKLYRGSNDGLIHIMVSRPGSDDPFELTGKRVSPGKWHRVPGKLSPVEGVDPEEAEDEDN